MSTNKLSLALEKGNLEEIKNYTEDIIHEIINTKMENPDYTFADDQLRRLSILTKVEDFFTEDLISKVPGLDKTYSDLLLVQGIIFLKKSDYSSSLNYLQKALIKYEKTDNKNGLANCYLFLGDNYIITGEKEKAISYFELALNFYNKKETINQYMITTNHIAVWFGFAGEISLSIEYFEKSLANGLKYNEMGIQAAANHGLGWNYQTKGELDLALDFFKKALAITNEIKKIQPYYLDMWIYQQMGSNFQLRKEIEKAIEYLRMSLDISLKINNLFATAWNYYLLIGLFLEENKLFDARDYLKKFENYTIKNKDNLTIEMIYELSSGLVLYNSVNPLEKKLAQNKFLKVLNS
ncbi:MAG: tetratricopeptide repeat protein [Asgard group archaeon]|nr:tetratricopeptide repeat protein [Asgard group archaeon]